MPADTKQKMLNTTGKFLKNRLVYLLIKTNQRPTYNYTWAFNVYYKAFFAVAINAEKLVASWIAISESILRFNVISAFLRPFMNDE